jgi:alpha-tubulin suppressor-like RCC1 family protein
MNSSSRSSSSTRSTSCSENHCIEVQDGIGYIWATNSKRGNRFGQLGRRSNSRTTKQCDNEYDDIKIPQKIDIPCAVAAAGGSKDSGHTLLVDKNGQVFAWGCDRWQQLGLGSTKAGAAGYTWKEGKLWQYYPQIVSALSGQVAVAVAAGADHSVALLESGEVWTWGRGEHGQLGQQGKPFVLPPTKSDALSSGPNVGTVRSIRAEANCTGIFGGKMNSDGTRTLLKSVGRCPQEILEMWEKVH